LSASWPVQAQFVAEVYCWEVGTWQAFFDAETQAASLEAVVLEAAQESPSSLGQDHC
jgi:hypothetical protein